MSDAAQGISGSNGAIQMPVKVTSGGNEKTSQAISQNSVAGNVLSSSMDQKGTYATVTTGSAQILPSSTTAKVAMEINSVSRDVLISMKKLPAPINLAAVAKIEREIKDGTYVIDTEKVVAALQKAYAELM
jgi:anti-sigma28 factor (negative regulator of flagellin synthesis)